MQLLNGLGDSSQAKAFLETLWPSGIPYTTGFLPLVFKQMKGGFRTKRVLSIEEAVAALESKEFVDNGQRLVEHNVYFGPLMSLEVRLDGRGSNDDVVALPGIFVDIDVRDDRAHAKENLPSSIEEAKTLVAKFAPLSPSLMWTTGYGLQVGWLFDTPYHIIEAADRLRIGSLKNRWEQHLRSGFAELGYHLDHVYDLSRVLRLPGTLNWKNPESPRQASLLFVDGPRYRMEDLELYCPLTARGSGEPRDAKPEFQILHISFFFVREG
jgi:hypothetical protein